MNNDCYEPLDLMDEDQTHKRGKVHIDPRESTY